MSEAGFRHNASFPKSPRAKTKELLVQEAGEELLVYNLGSDKAICLNHTAALVWQACDGESDVSQIAKKLEKELDSPVDEDVVWLALDQLGKEDLLLGNGLPGRFDGLSRREVFKKIGLAATVALPVISSIVAPTAAHAQTCVNPGGALPGQPGSSCFSSSTPQCQGICNNSCCSGSGTLSPPGGPCNLSVVGCTCTCN